MIKLHALFIFVLLFTPLFESSGGGGGGGGLISTVKKRSCRTQSTVAQQRIEPMTEYRLQYYHTLYTTTRSM